MFTISTGLFLNISIIALIIVLFVFLVEYMNFHEKEKQMYGATSGVIEKKKFLTNNKIFKRYHDIILQFLRERGKEEQFNLYYYGVIGASFFVALFFLSMKQVFFAVVAMVGINYAIYYILKMLLNNTDEQIEEQLPVVIDTMVKVFSKYGDLKSVVYETAQTIEDPLKTQFVNLSRRMISESNQEKCLLDFADELNNIWIHSMIFILLSYREDTTKEEVVVNLRHLGSIIEKENNLKNTDVTDKRYGVVLNYLLAGIAFVASLANIFINPAGKHFFFGTLTGIISLTIGYIAIISSIVVSIKLSKKRRG